MGAGALIGKVSEVTLAGLIFAQDLLIYEEYLIGTARHDFFIHLKSGALQSAMAAMEAR